MLLTKLKIATAVLAVMVIGVGSGILAYRPQAAETLVGDQGLGKQESSANADSDSKSDDSKILQLQKERLAVLKEIAAEKKDAYMRGQLAPDELLRADLAVLRAELELSESDNARVLIHEKIVANTKGQEQYISQTYKAGRLGHSDVLTAKVNRLEAEIDLARAKAKAAPKLK